MRPGRGRTPTPVDRRFVPSSITGTGSTKTSARASRRVRGIDRPLTRSPIDTL
jgi:hypothetical protein